MDLEEQQSLASDADQAVGPEALPAGPDGSANEPPAAELPAGSSRRKGFARRVIGGTFNYGLAQNIALLVRFLLIPIYTRFLTPRDYGIAGMCGQMSSFLTIGMRCGVPGAVTRYYFDHREGASLRDYVTTTAKFMLTASVSIGCILLLVGHWLFPLWDQDILFVPFGIMVIVNAVVDSNTELQDRLIMAREQSSYRLRLNVLQTAVQIILGVLFVVGFRWGPAGLMGSYGVANALYLLLAVRYLRPELKGRFRRDMLWTSLAYSISILPHHLLGSFAPVANSWIVARQDSTDAVGVFFLAFRFMTPPLLLAAAFQTAYNPIYFSVREERTDFGLRRLAITARNVWGLAMAGALAGSLLGPALIVVVTPASYHLAAALLPILMVGFLGRALNTVLGPEIYYSKKFWLVPVVSFTALAVSLTVVVLTVRHLGPAALAWGEAARCLVEALLAGIISCRLVKIPHQWFSLVRIALCGLLAAAVVALLPQFGMLSDRVADVLPGYRHFAAWAEAHFVWAQFAVGTIGVLLFPLLLLATGDPSIREGFAFARRQMTRFGGQTA